MTIRYVALAAFACGLAACGPNTDVKSIEYIIEEAPVTGQAGGCVNFPPNFEADSRRLWAVATTIQLGVGLIRPGCDFRQCNLPNYDVQETNAAVLQIANQSGVSSEPRTYLNWHYTVTATDVSASASATFTSTLPDDSLLQASLAINVR